MQAHSIYIHIPFCKHRCAYCDFNTYAGKESLRMEYVEALIKEIQIVSKSGPNSIPIHTIFFGGGTPSLLECSAIASMISAVRSNFDLAADAEITLEANPRTLNRTFLSEIKEAGVNRLSIGMQSADPEELQLLERQHDYSDVAHALAQAKFAGIENINLDLIFGLPDQAIAKWENSLELALQLEPAHISLYALSFEHGTPFSKMLDKGLLPFPDPDLAADMYQLAEEKLERNGFLQYEISNWAIANESGLPMSCAHNIQYWRNLPYFGFGAGAHGWVSGLRTRNVLSPEAYIGRINVGEIIDFPKSSATLESSMIDRQTEMSETMMMGLRLVQEGVSLEIFEDRFNASLEDVYGAQIEQLVAKELLELGIKPRENLRLSKKGKLLGNQVFQEFV